MAFRNKFLILKETQLNMVFSFLLMFLIITVITLSNFYYFSLFLREFILNETEAAGMNQILNTAFAAFRWKVFYIAFADIVILLIMGVMLSHRIAGPIYQICRILSEYKNGNLKPEVHLRRTDLLFELSDSCNDMRTSLAQQLSEISQIVSSLPESEKTLELKKKIAFFKL